MAEIEKKHYNLRSGIDTAKLPAHIHISNDSEFLHKVLQNDQDSDSSDSSDSDLNCSAVVENSDSEQVDKQNIQSASSTSRSASDTHTSLSDVAVQQAINVQILSQLSSISDRLQVLEKNNIKKHSDPKKMKGASKKKTSSQVASVTVPPTQVELPDLNKIRQDAYIQSQVDQRLRDLANNDNSGTKIKSFRGGPIEVVVPNQVKWLQEFVLSRFKKKRIQYDNLSVVQWVAGFCWILREEKDLQVSEHMLDYLIALVEDANDFSWGAARASHAVPLCRMEQGEVKGYGETDKLDRIRRADAQRHVTTSPNEAKNSQKKFKSTKVLTCSYFNQGTCVHQRSHDTKGIMYRHICNYCFQQNGKTYPHSEQNSEQ